jgi:hypothetical protein
MRLDEVEVSIPRTIRGDAETNYFLIIILEDYYWVVLESCNFLPAFQADMPIFMVLDNDVCFSAGYASLIVKC